MEYKHKNTGTSSCKSICISELQCFNSSVKCWKAVSLKPFGVSIEIWSQFHRLVCFDWVHKKVFTSFILEKNPWAHDKQDILMHENNILWEVTAPKYTVLTKKNIRASKSFKCILL